jgi:hypothetical protein
MECLATVYFLSATLGLALVILLATVHRPSKISTAGIAWLVCGKRGSTRIEAHNSVSKLSQTQQKWLRQATYVNRNIAETDGRLHCGLSSAQKV